MTTWHLLRLKESRGFISRRIFHQITNWQASVYGMCFYAWCGKYFRIFTHDEVYKELEELERECP